MGLVGARGCGGCSGGSAEREGGWCRPAMLVLSEPMEASPVPDRRPENVRETGPAAPAEEERAPEKAGRARLLRAEREARREEGLEEAAATAAAVMSGPGLEEGGAAVAEPPPLSSERKPVMSSW